MKTIQIISEKHDLAGMLFMLVILFTSCKPQEAEQLSLKKAFHNDFLMGAALNESQILGKDSLSAKIIETQFNSLTAENCMKWERIHPQPGVYNFELTDKLADYAGENEMHLQGHVLVWHSQTPRWVFQDAEGNLTTRDTLLMRMKDHIQTVVGRYKGRVDSWDVVNEAIGDDGLIRNSLWYQIIGEDFIEKAFTFAHEADPEAGLIYNDYSLPNPAKRDAVVTMVRNLQSKGIKIDGIGMQGHYHLDNPPLEDIKASVEAFAALGLQVSFTEVEINVLPSPGAYAGADISTKFEMEERLNPYREGLPDSVQHVLAMRYKALFELFLDHSDQIDRVTFWGVHDGLSWKNNWPVRGRTNYPLLFDRKGNPKPAFDEVIKLASSRQ